MYLSQHRTIGLRFSQSSQPITGFSDSDWATRHSTSGYVFMYNQAAISWASKKQPSVALSSCEAKIIAASEATKEAVYLRTLFDDLGLKQNEPTPLAMDNKSAIDLAYNPVPRAPPALETHRPASFFCRRTSGNTRHHRTIRSVNGKSCGFLYKAASAPCVF
eukprot:6187824-Pleurochrysis_carterae.AAC.2